jgi:hypothetical protein
VAAAAELVLLLVLIIPVLTIVALVDLLRRPASAWELSDENQAVWALVVIFLAVIGPILYLTIARPKLAAATTITP